MFNLKDKQFRGHLGISGLVGSCEVQCGSSSQQTAGVQIWPGKAAASVATAADVALQNEVP